jgi:hypothetical protein
LLIFLEDFLIVFKLEYIPLQLDDPASIGREIQAFEVGLKMFEDPRTITIISDLVVIKIYDFFQELLLLKIK